MPSVDAAPAHTRAPLVDADAARRLSTLPAPAAPAGPTLHGSADFFARLFASARLARQERQEVERRAELTESAGERRREREKAVNESAQPEPPSEPRLPDAPSKAAARRERLREQVQRDEAGAKGVEARAGRQDAQVEQHAAPTATHPGQAAGGESTTAQTAPTASPGSPAASTVQASSEIATSPALASTGESASGTMPLDAAPPDGWTADAQAAGSGAGGRPAIAPVVPGGANASARPLTPMTAASPFHSGTESAGSDTARPGPAGNTADGGEGAKTARTAGSFDHLLQAASRTRGQLAARAIASTHWRGLDVLRPDEPHSVNELARIVRTAGRDGQTKMLLRLDPPELGQMRIDVRMQDATLTLRMETQTQAGHDALLGRLSELKQALEQQGVHVQHMEVELRPPVTPPMPPEQSWHHQDPGQQDGAGSGQPQDHSPDHGERNPGRERPEEWFGSGHSTQNASGDAVAGGYARRLNLVA